MNNIFSKKMKRSIGSLFVIFLMLFATNIGATSSEKLVINPVVAVNEEIINIPIIVTLENISGVQFHLDYDDSLIQSVGVIGCSSDYLDCSSDIAFPYDGKITITYYNIYESLTLNNEALLTLQFQVKSEDNVDTNIAFNNKIIVDNNDIEIQDNIIFEDGIISLNPDNQAPILAEVTPVGEYINNNSPEYIFSSSEAGVITYAGDCISTTTEAVIGNNVIVFDCAENKVYDNCKVNVTDESGNKSNTLNVSAFSVDTVSPVITLLGDSSVSFVVGDNYIDAGATALDNIDGDITSSIVVTGLPNMAVVNNYTVAYNVTDRHGNSAGQITREVIVNAKPAPAPIISSGGGGGGGGYFPTCKNVTYGEWSECKEGLQSREILSKGSSSNCRLNIQQKNKKTRVCREISVKKTEGVVLGVKLDYRTVQLNKILAEATIVNGHDISLILENSERQKNNSLEIKARDKYMFWLAEEFDLSNDNYSSIVNFIVYGTESTNILGESERAGVLNSYKAAFGKLPTSKTEWEDLLKIASGRWPTERSEKAETFALKAFKKVYLRNADRKNANDDAAITIMAYGLRPDMRNIDAEKQGIKIFMAIYKYVPTSANDWDTVRAIAYSGATR